MLLIAAVSLSLFSHLPHLPTLGHARLHTRPAAGPKLPARVGAWRVEGRLDRFAGTRACAISGHGVSLHWGALVFRVATHGDTRQAVFRVDGGPPRAVANAFETVEALGFFPQRGWIVDPEGGETVLPATVASGAKTIAIRADVRQAPRRFKVARLDDAIAAARSAGCDTVIP